MGDKRGYTLVELLVALAIASIGIAMLISFQSLGYTIWKKTDSQSTAYIGALNGISRMAQLVRGAKAAFASPADRLIIHSLDGAEIAFYFDGSKSALVMESARDGQQVLVQNAKEATFHVTGQVVTMKLRVQNEEGQDISMTTKVKLRNKPAGG